MARCGKYVPIDMNESKCANEYQEGDQKKGETYALSASKCEISDHAMTETTDEFGVINFATNGANGRKFVRVDTSTDMLYDKLEWMINMLKMGKPNLLISVTGNTTNCEIKPRLKDVFQRSLIKAASTTGAWIITEGFHAGAANVVGDAVQYYRETSANRGPVVVIGIAPWGVIQNSLIRNDKKGSGPAEYLIADNEISNDKCLDPNHSHFILVDNGTHKAVTEITFRAKLEKTISKLNPSEGTVDSISLGSVLSYVPRVILVLKGGSRALETVRHALSQSTPAVIIKGSGGAADILAYFFMKRANRAIEGIETEIRKHMERINFGSKSEHKDNIKRILDCLDRSALIHILEWNSDIDAHDLEMAMLKALLNDNYGWMMETLGLALVLDKVDIAKSDIFTDMYTDDNKTQTVRLEKIMLLAIKMDRVNFVELFLDQGIRITDCLKYKILLLLYNQASTQRTIKILFNKICREKFEREWNGTIDATKAEQLKQYLRRDLLNEMDATAGDNDAGDAQDLFLWSVLTNRLKMAEMFWRRSKDPMATALIGSALFSAMSHRISDRELMTSLKDNANVFTKMAIGVLNESHRKDEKQAQQLLALETSSWGNVPCVRIAAKVKNEEFISQPECLEYFKNTWKGQLKQDNGPLKLFICTIIPVLIPLIATFKENSGAGLASGGDAAVYDVKVVLGHYIS